MTSIKPMTLLVAAVLTLQIVEATPAGAAARIRVASIPAPASATSRLSAAGTRHDDALKAKSLRTVSAPGDSLTDQEPQLPSQAAFATGARHPLDIWLMVVLSIAIVGAQLKRKQRLLGHRLR